MPSEKNYHSSKLNFLTLKWSAMEHSKEDLAYMPFVVRTDNNPLTYVLTTPNLDATGHRWIGTLALIEFAQEYQKGADNGVADALSRVPICHNHKVVWSLLEGAIVGVVDREEAEVSKELLIEHEHLGNEAWVQATRMAPMHIVDLGEAQEADPMLATCSRWLYTCKYTPFLKWDTVLRKYLGDNVNMEEVRALFHVLNSLVMSKGLLYVSNTPKGEEEGVLAFLVLTDQHHMVLNGVHHDAGHQGQQRMLALTQERFWWPMMVKDCCALV